MEMPACEPHKHKPVILRSPEGWGWQPAFGLAVKLLVRTAMEHAGVLGSSLAAAGNSSFLLMWSVGGRGDGTGIGDPATHLEDVN